MSAEGKDIEYFEDDAPEAADAADGEAAASAEGQAAADDETAAAPEADAAAAAAPEANAADDDEGEEEELYELEFSEDDVVAYLEDEDGNEVGVVVMEDGEEVEYYYADEEGVEYVAVDDASSSASGEVGDYAKGITREKVAETTADMNAIFKETVAVGTELKDAFGDIKDSFDALTGKNRNQKR